MAFEQRPNNGSLFESKPEAKTDYNGKIIISEPGSYVMFGRKKTIISNKDQKKYNIIEISLVKDRYATQPSNQPVASCDNSLQSQKGDLPF